jgi:pimeloyl-ACP methyl ester carboxylesterase
MSMIEKSLMSLGPHGFHKIAYTQWGDAHNRRALICVHGLTRTGRDFDFIAEALADVYRIACPDLPGRGHSHWLAVHADYTPLTYMADMTALIARLGVDEVDWIGTSLGGQVGMLLAAQPNSPIRKLVLNDIGAVITRPSLERISGYVGKDPVFPDLAALEAYLRDVNAPFGPLTDAQWRHLAEHSARRDLQTESWRLHYDPGIAEPFKEGFSKDLELWPVWEAIASPTLILRGAESDLLLKDTAEEMLTRGPEAELIEFPGVGHAPMLMDPAQIRAVREWLLD